MDIEIIKSNIVAMDTDAIVLPANEHLKEGPGASRAIFEAAGRRDLTRDCKELKYCELGSAVVTFGYNLQSDYIIHAVVPKWIDGQHDEYAYLSSAYLSCLKLADVLKIKSIAFPLLASGNNGFDINLAIKIALESVNSYDSDHLQKIIFVVNSTKVANAFEKLGFEVNLLPENIAILEKKVLKKKNKIQAINVLKTEGKRVGIEIAKAAEEELLDTALKAIKDPDTRKNILENGKKVFKKVNN